MNYTLHQLQIFSKIVEKQSITKAADELFLTQPAVSIQLKKFQDQFDIPLTEVIGRKLFITEFGMEIANVSRRILSEADEIKHQTLAFKGLLTGQLKLSVVSTGKYVMPYFLNEFINTHPGIELKMDVTNKTSVVKTLERNETDFALVSILPDNLEIESVKLMENKLFLVKQKSSSKAPQRITPGQLALKPLIYREQGSATRQSMEHFLGTKNIQSKRVLELTSNEAVKQAVLAGLGYSIMPLIGIRNEILNHELEIVPMSGLPITTHWNLVWLKHKSHSPVASAYLDHIREQKGEIIASRFKWFEEYLKD